MKVIKLRLYKGLKLLFNEEGQVENKNQYIKLVDGEEWLNYLSLITAQGLCKVTLESVLDIDRTVVKEVSNEYFNGIANQLKEACGTSLRVQIIEQVKEEKEVPVKEKKATDESKDLEKEERAELRAKLKEAGITFSPAATLEVLKEKAKLLN